MRNIAILTLNPSHSHLQLRPMLALRFIQSPQPSWISGHFVLFFPLRQLSHCGQKQMSVHSYDKRMNNCTCWPNITRSGLNRTHKAEYCFIYCYYDWQVFLQRSSTCEKRSGAEEAHGAHTIFLTSQERNTLGSEDRNLSPLQFLAPWTLFCFGHSVTVSSSSWYATCSDSFIGTTSVNISREVWAMEYYYFLGMLEKG